MAKTTKSKPHAPPAGTTAVYFRAPSDFWTRVKATALAERRTVTSQVLTMLQEGLDARRSNRQGAHLIAFGHRAGKIVAAITRQAAVEDRALEGALANVSVAIESQ